MNCRLVGKVGESTSRGLRTTLARPWTVFTLAFVVRVLAIPLAVFRVTPYSQADATAFSVVAGLVANRILSGSVSVATRYSEIYEIWGSVLAPFWFFPVGGPILARIFLSAISAYAIYNVVLMVRRVGSPMAGLLAAIPLIFYPSIFLVQSTLLREAAILFCVTTAARLLLAVGDGDQNALSTGRLYRRSAAFVLLSVGLLAFAVILREDNLPLYVLAIAAGFVTYYVTEWWGKILIAPAVVGGLLGAWTIRERVIDLFNFFREARGDGRTAYLTGVRFDSLLDLLAFAPIGAVYFLFAPFPWQIESALDIPVMIEGLANILYALAGIVGIAVALKRDRVLAIGLGTYFIFGITLYGFGTANFGTATRHRQMFSWVLFIFGSLGAHWLWVQYAPPNWKKTIRQLS